MKCLSLSLSLLLIEDEGISEWEHSCQYDVHDEALDESVPLNEGVPLAWNLVLLSHFGESKEKDHADSAEVEALDVSLKSLEFVHIAI